MHLSYTVKTYVEMYLSYTVKKIPKCKPDIRKESFCKNRIRPQGGGGVSTAGGRGLKLFPYDVESGTT